MVVDRKSAVKVRLILRAISIGGGGGCVCEGVARQRRGGGSRPLSTQPDHYTRVACHQILSRGSFDVQLSSLYTQGGGTFVNE